MRRVQLLQAFPCHVRIDGGGRDVGVPEEQLHDAQIGTVIQEMGRERVPKHVR